MRNRLLCDFTRRGIQYSPMAQRAVILTGGKQYMVASGDRIVVDALPTPLRDKKEIVWEKVLAVFDDKDMCVGQPYVPGAKVHARILTTEKGEKVRVSRFRAKSRYRRVRNFRPLFTEVEVTSISIPHTK